MGLGAALHAHCVPQALMQRSHFLTFASDTCTIRAMGQPFGQVLTATYSFGSWWPRPSDHCHLVWHAVRKHPRKKPIAP